MCAAARAIPGHRSAGDLEAPAKDSCPRRFKTLLRVTPSARHTRAAAWRPPRITMSARAAFFPGDLCGFPQDLILLGLLSQQSLQLADLLVLGFNFGCWNHFLIRPDGTQCSLTGESASTKQRAGRDLVLTSHQADGHPRLRGPLDQSLLLFGTESSTALHSKDLDLCTRHRHIPAYVSYFLDLDIRSFRSFGGLLQFRCVMN
jgi:hypothetical protein